MNCVTNPYQATIGGRVFIGSAGQPVDDLRKFTRPIRTISPVVADDSIVTSDTDATSSLPASSPALSADAESTASGAARQCVEYLEEMLRWRHMAPTAPDTLDVYPHFNTDPFVLEDTPHVFFAANQPAFEAKKVCIGVENNGKEGEENVLVVSVPRFSTTGEAVLIDITTLDCAPIRLRSYEHPTTKTDAEIPPEAMDADADGDAYSK